MEKRRGCLAAGRPIAAVGTQQLHWLPHPCLCRPQSQPHCRTPISISTPRAAKRCYTIGVRSRRASMTHWQRHSQAKRSWPAPPSLARRLTVPPTNRTSPDQPPRYANLRQRESTPSPRRMTDFGLQHGHQNSNTLGIVHAAAATLPIPTPASPSPLRTLHMQRPDRCREAWWHRQCRW